MTTPDDNQTMDMMGADDNFEDAVEQLVSEPTIEREVETVLTDGGVIKTYEGTSQYAQNGISACGLASFNAIRCVLQLEADGVFGASLLQEMMNKDLVEMESVRRFTNRFARSLALWRRHTREDSAGAHKDRSSSSQVSPQGLLCFSAKFGYLRGCDAVRRLALPVTKYSTEHALGWHLYGELARQRGPPFVATDLGNFGCMESMGLALPPSLMSAVQAMFT